MDIITDEEIEELPLPGLEELEGKIQVPKKLGRAEGKPNIPQLNKELMAIHSNMGAGQAKLGELFGVSQAEVSIIERGIDRTNIEGRKDNESLKSLGLEAKNRAMGVAEEKLLRSLEIYDPEALEQKELPGAASKLAGVYEKLSGNRQQGGPTVNFIVYQPRAKDEADFGEIIDLKER